MADNKDNKVRSIEDIIKTLSDSKDISSNEIDLILNHEAQKPANEKFKVAIFEDEHYQRDIFNEMYGAAFNIVYMPEVERQKSESVLKEFDSYLKKGLDLVITDFYLRTRDTGDVFREPGASFSGLILKTKSEAKDIPVIAISGNPEEASKEYSNDVIFSKAELFPKLTLEIFKRLYSSLHHIPGKVSTGLVDKNDSVDKTVFESVSVNDDPYLSERNKNVKDKYTVLCLENELGQMEHIRRSLGGYVKILEYDFSHRAKIEEDCKVNRDIEIKSYKERNGVDMSDKELASIIEEDKDFVEREFTDHFVKFLKENLPKSDLLFTDINLGVRDVTGHYVINLAVTKFYKPFLATSGEPLNKQSIGSENYIEKGWNPEELREKLFTCYHEHQKRVAMGTSYNHSQYSRYANENLIFFQGKSNLHPAMIATMEDIKEYGNIINISASNPTYTGTIKSRRNALYGVLSDVMTYERVSLNTVKFVAKIYDRMEDVALASETADIADHIKKTFGYKLNMVRSYGSMQTQEGHYKFPGDDVYVVPVVHALATSFKDVVSHIDVWKDKFEKEGLKEKFDYMLRAMAIKSLVDLNYWQSNDHCEDLRSMVQEVDLTEEKAKFKKEPKNMKLANDRYKKTIWGSLDGYSDRNDIELMIDPEYALSIYDDFLTDPDMLVRNMDMHESNFGIRTGMVEPNFDVFRDILFSLPVTGDDFSSVHEYVDDNEIHWDPSTRAAHKADDSMRLVNSRRFDMLKQAGLISGSRYDIARKYAESAEGKRVPDVDYPLMSLYNNIRFIDFIKRVYLIRERELYEENQSLRSEFETHEISLKFDRANHFKHSRYDFGALANLIYEEGMNLPHDVSLYVRSIKPERNSGCVYVDYDRKRFAYDERELVSQINSIDHEPLKKLCSYKYIFDKCLEVSFFR